jgi:tetratricopeptide (TPR) repeat protein
MFKGRQFFGVVGIALMVSGCRLPGMEGPVPKSLATSRQLSQKGVAAGERGQWDQAEPLLADAVRACPVDPDARRNYAEALWNRGSHKEAAEQLIEAIRLTPDDATLHARLAEVRLATGQPDLALESAQRAINLEPKMASAWAVRGGAMWARRQPLEALADYHRALAYRPDDRKVLLGLAEIYRELNRPDRALTILQGLAESYPPGEEPPRVLYLEGLAYLAEGRYDAAVEVLSAARAGERPTAEVLFALAKAQWSAGRAADAASAAEQALAIDPRHQPSRQLLGEIGLARQCSGREIR